MRPTPRPIVLPPLPSVVTPLMPPGPDSGPRVLAGASGPAVVAFVVRAWRSTPHNGLGVNALHSVRVLNKLGVPAVALAADSLDHVRQRLAGLPRLRLVVLEAFWFTPEELSGLALALPRAKVLARSHSQWAFLAGDGHARFVFAFAQQGRLAGNHARFVNALLAARPESACDLLPNLYDVPPRPPSPAQRDDVAGDGAIDIASFGANRPGKHHTVAALAAAIVARERARPVRFHVNTRRDEGANWDLVRALAATSDGRVNLVEHPWTDWASFAQRVGAITLGFQLSATETCNLVTADLAAQGVPSVVGEAIDWGPPDHVAPIDDPLAAARKALQALDDPTAGPRWRAALETHQRAAQALWLDWLAQHGVTPTPPPPPGVGDHFAQLVHRLGFERAEGCGCDALRATMNELGPLCLQLPHRDELLAGLRANAQAQGLFAGPLGAAASAGFDAAALALLALAVARART